MASNVVGIRFTASQSFEGAVADVRNWQTIDDITLRGEGNDVFVDISGTECGGEPCKLSALLGSVSQVRYE